MPLPFLPSFLLVPLLLLGTSLAQTAPRPISRRSFFLQTSFGPSVTSLVGVGGPPEGAYPPKSRAEVVAGTFASCAAWMVASVCINGAFAAVREFAAYAAVAAEEGAEEGAEERETREEDGPETGEEAKCKEEEEEEAPPPPWSLRAELFRNASALLSWTLSFLPDKIARGHAPGFVFAAVWILLPLRRLSNSPPNLPVRLSHLSLGRISARDVFLLVLPVHFFSALLSVRALSLLLPAPLVASCLAPVVYDESAPFLLDFLREVTATAVFVVGAHVVPELVRINRGHPALAAAVLFPIYLLSVDGKGTGGAFAPEAVYALQYVSKMEEVPLRQKVHLFGPLVGGLLGGRVLKTFFPDV